MGLCRDQHKSLSLRFEQFNIEIGSIENCCKNTMDLKIKKKKLYYSEHFVLNFV